MAGEMVSNKEKYKNVILYLLHGLGGTIEGKKKLAKLLYYVDFDMFEYRESMVGITGDTYRKWRMGPVPSTYEQTLKDMQAQGMVKIEQKKLYQTQHPTEVFTCIAEPDTALFSEAERFIMDRVIRKYGGLTGKQLEVLTHAEAPFIAAESNDEIDLELSLYRGTDFRL
jgi:uncharacterized phage-associated protein